jgi:mono/diheme cytochrome c family protein
MRRGWLKRTLLVLCGLALVAAGGLFLIAWRSAVPPLSASTQRFDPAEIMRGAQLAGIGNCVTCHTRVGGKPYAGGRPIDTPFGAIHATNITPAPETGIGTWSEAAFIRAMREGVSRDGRHLYPAFPYDHMTLMREEDIRAVYAFLMTRAPVEARTPPNDLPFPLNLRPLVALWKVLFLDRGPMQPEATKDAAWNRGAYLVEGLAHCGACHTPRNLLGAEKKDQAYAGGSAEGWHAPALNEASPAAIPWDAERLHRYLRFGFDPLHGQAAGPMLPVVNNLAGVADEDVRAIAVFVAAIAGTPTLKRQLVAEGIIARTKAGVGMETSAESGDGAAIYAGACAQCHGEAGRTPAVPALNLALSSTLRAPVPDNAIRIVLDGIVSDDDTHVMVMPGFASALTDGQIALLVAHLRDRFAGLPAWDGLPKSVGDARKELDRQRSAQQARAAR